MKKRIVIDARERKFLALAFGVTEQSVHYALNFKRNSDLSNRIRTLALERGGEVLGCAKLETSYEDDIMVQTYGGRLRIETNLKSGETTVYVDGQKEVCLNNLRIDEYTRLQQRYIRKVNVQ